MCYSNIAWSEISDSSDFPVQYSTMSQKQEMELTGYHISRQAEGTLVVLFDSS